MSSFDIVGVTVGIGSPYEELAALASSCFRAHTGIPSITLGPEMLRASGLSHAAALRLKLFDFVDAEIVVYFDADWFCLRPWNPLSLAESSHLLACRDFVLTQDWPRQDYDFRSTEFGETPALLPRDVPSDALRLDYIREIAEFADIQLPWHRWINSGLLIMRKKEHKPWLELALKLYTGEVGHHSKYYEQPALVKAIELMNLPVRPLARCYNVLAASERRWPKQVVGLHVKISRNPTFVSRVVDGSISSPSHVLETFGP